MKRKIKLLVVDLVYYIHRLLIKILPICHGYSGLCFFIGKRQRQMTMYNDDRLNYVFMCKQCFNKNQESWEERWKDYYSSVF